MKQGFVTMFAVLAIVVAAGTAQAVPILQLWSPGGVYDTTSESWFVTQNPFTLQVLGASHGGNVTWINDPFLYVAVPDTWWNPNATVTLTGPEYPNGLTITTWQTGTPAALSSHGIYPTHYQQVQLPNMGVGTGTDVVNDYTGTEGGQDTGVIYEYTISYADVAGLHLDASGTALKKNGKFQDVFAPYSHDVEADADVPVPEPAALVLFAVGLFGLGIRRRV